MKKYLPVVNHKRLGWVVKCPVTGEFIQLSHHKNSCIPSGDVKNDSTCKYHKHIDETHELVEESITDYVWVCDVPKKELMETLF